MRMGLIIKRGLDLLLSIVLIILLSPLLFVVAVSVLICLGRPVIFRQQRPGEHGKIFTMYKFRTMLNKTDRLGRFTSDGERLTSFGKFLRSTSLDELPELFNVFKGDMSFVGPRPLLPEYLELYTPEQARRHEVKPGITGWAQVNGRNAISWEKKFEYDVWYVDNWSIGLDFKILYMTFVKVFKREGVSQDGHATMEAFKGSKDDEIGM